MKTFLTICTCAMVSAGIYGFADMAHDVKNGTMISYDRGETATSVTATMLRSGNRYAIRVKDIRKAPAHFDLKDPVKKEAVKTPATPDLTFTGLTKSFSRASVDMEDMLPVTEEQLQAGAAPAQDISTLLSAGTDTDPATATTISLKKPVKVPAVITPVVVADSVVTEPGITATTDIKADSVPQLDVPKEEFDYRDFSRGSPRKYKKKKQ